MNRQAVLTTVLLVLLAVMALASLLAGSVWLNPADLLSPDPQQEGLATLILWQLRVPRTVLAIAIGAALGLSGAALQGLTRNPLAEPGLLGVSTGASLGAVIALYFGLAAA